MVKCPGPLECVDAVSSLQKKKIVEDVIWNLFGTREVMNTQRDVLHPTPKVEGERVIVPCRQTTGDLGEVPHRARLGRRLRGRCITQLYLWRNVCQGPKKEQRMILCKPKPANSLFIFLSFPCYLSQ